ncbi:MarR family transcriptional regulator [Sphingomonas oleivorans]|uniref:MarR family transcriptional regulator n=1 Tax=Sphingomonas oleivorans TaxID=1735121 RepID=A0A2T5FUR0_9SPHN|nr:MarR family transcriptional regulator [Sphingomonas oleivorans]PTQ08263.1 MarR family transcriptional regulator [Sphingomonas oleivorans]
MADRDGGFAKRLIRWRRKRDELLGEALFGDPAWDMMLDLFAAQEEGKQVSVSSLCIAAAVPATTGLRWINILVDRGILLKKDDERDRRRIWVELTPDYVQRMRTLLRAGRQELIG